MISRIRELWHARPFAPFSLHLADGRSFDVPHPDFFYLSPTAGRMFVVDADENYHYLNPLVIVSVSEKPESQQAGL